MADSGPGKRAGEMLRGGRTATAADLAAAGIPREAVGRLVGRDVLKRCSRGYYTLAQEWDGNPLPVLAARFGGEPCRPRGVVCLQMAAYLHDLTDMGLHQMDRPEVAVPFGGSNRTGGIPVRLIRLKDPHQVEDLEWREFGGHGIHVTGRERTVCDLFAPWSGILGEGMAREAFGRLMADDFMSARRVRFRAEKLGWGARVAEAYEAMMVLRKFSDVPEDGLSQGGMRL
jgi:hypothetical protein